MYCSHCGAPVLEQNVVCPSCNATLPFRTSQSRVGRYSERLPGHVHLLAIFWYVIGVLWLIPAGIMLAVGSAAFLAVPGDEPGAQFMRWMGPFVLYMVAAFCGIIAVLCFTAGWGLLHWRPWARGLSIVLGIISLFHPPFGTALGIYTLWVLLSANAAEEYERLQAVS
jgi:hypothetical protein